ncbi:MAG TPA: chitobiase/beta-hexosaminidase C-terminal domain-containing protein, partial [Chthoniobacteraceae bacterium]|nr:chitobiase/beta-hexosaminidase C-terminal domain-containing protein [Chthoniobacteraceae bacterium]
MHPIQRFAVAPAAFFLALAAALAAPTVTVTTPTPGNTVSSLTSIAITFNEAVTGVDADDLLINAEAAQLVSGSGVGPYTFTFSQPPPGMVNVAFDGDHGIVGQGGTGSFVPAGPWTYTLNDTIAPTVAQLTPASASTVGTLTQVEVIFSEEVLGVDAADLTVNGNPADSVTGSGFGPYVFTFVQPSFGTVNFAWSGTHGITDTAASPNAFGGGNWSVTRSATGPGNIVINEFLASNGTGLPDENGDQEDWIELYNPGPSAVNLVGWALTNDPNDPGMWVLPSRTLNANAYLIVFASGKNRKPVSGNLHTNFKLNEFGGYLALSPPDSPRAAVSQFPPNYNPNGNPPVTEYPPQRTDYSYGPQTGGALRYFSPPKPNAANGTSSLTAITPTVNVSVSRGFFKDPFQLVLSCPDAGATIRYTTDFSEPTASNGIVYSGPITINTTRCLRAVAVVAGKISSLPVTHSYIFLDQVLSQPANPPGFPNDWGTTYASNTFPPASSVPGLVPTDYAMDSDPLRVDPNNPGSAIDPVKQQRFMDGMRELPLVSVTVPMIDMFGANGLYYYPNVTNKSFGYKKCAVEMILPDGSTAFTTICGISGHGNASREPIKNPKHGFQLKFKGDYGDNSLSYKLYEDSPVEEFDDIIVRPDFNSSWRHWSDSSGNGNGAFQRTRATRLRDAFVKNTFRDMGDLASHHRFIHLFINGLYWGTYDFAEQPVDGFGASYLGGVKADYDVIHEGNVRAGDAAVYSAMANAPATTTNALYDQMKGYLDVTEFIDYMLLHFYIGHQDWGNVKNWYAIRRRASTLNPTQGKYMYIPWDDECTLLESNVNRVSNTDVPSGIHTKLLNH